MIEKNVVIERVNQVANKVRRDVVVDLDTHIENIQTVERLVENPIRIDTVLEKNVEYLVTRDVEVPVEKVIEVDVGVYVERPIFESITRQEDIEVETLVESYNHIQMPEEVTEHDDDEMTREIHTRKRDIEHQQQENQNLRRRFEQIQQRFVSIRSKFTSEEEKESIRLKAKLQELRCRLRNANE